MPVIPGVKSPRFVARVGLIDRTALTGILAVKKQTFPTRTEGSVKKHWYKVCAHIDSSLSAGGMSLLICLTL